MLDGLMANKVRTKTAKILLLEDDRDLQEVLRDYYAPRGYELVCQDDPMSTLNTPWDQKKNPFPYDLILTDLMMPNMTGIQFIERMKKVAPGVPIILMTAHSSVETAVKAIEAGAYDFVVKPLHFPQLNVSIERALRWRKLQEENTTLRAVAKVGQGFEGVVGKSPGIQLVFDLAKRVSNTVATVLINGESGTGKEVIARAIHQHGNRKNESFVAINCSAIPENLLESELFGHAKGAFTGAIDKKLGLFEEADKGTLFLDEIGDLNASLQAKLLRVLQEKKIKRIGENEYRSVNVRVIAATHKDLPTEVTEKRFREDLFFRLNVIPIKIPPLRERQQDILPLAEYFLKRFSVENGVTITGFTQAACHHMLVSQWRGNVRELENAIERAVVLCTGTEIDASDLAVGNSFQAPVQMRTSKITNDSEVPIESLPSLSEYDFEYIQYVLKRVDGVKERAARVLKLDRKTLYRRLMSFNPSLEV
jgi:DNA-binding NtrC family response regulator